MKLNTLFIDKLSISISVLCVAHCLIFPVLAVFIPNIIALGLTSENFHFWMIVSVIPSSAFALTLGCKKHANISMVIIGVVGLSSLLLALALDHSMLGEYGEKALTLIGALLIAFAHFRNFKLCQQHDNCHCEHTHE